MQLLRPIQPVNSLNILAEQSEAAHPHYYHDHTSLRLTPAPSTIARKHVKISLLPPYPAPPGPGTHPPTIARKNNSESHFFGQKNSKYPPFSHKKGKISPFWSKRWKNLTFLPTKSQNLVFKRFTFTIKWDLIKLQSPLDTYHGNN